MRLHQLIAKYAEGEKVLDIGFAYGPNTYIKDKILYGVDIAKAEKPANYLEVKRADLNKEPLSFENNFFDTVIMADVIEHVDNPSQTLRECYRVLKDGGRLIISTPQANY